MKRKKYAAVILLAVMVIIFWDTPFETRPPGKSSDSCAVYYLLNIDGMKGLGHAAFMLTDEQGNGQVYSYNGMQYIRNGDCLSWQMRGSGNRIG